MDTVSSTAARMGRSRHRGAVAAAAFCLLATGCTMCPDPFDYTGPVPNGAVSQNDFAARSNSILPVRATPLPWPPIVESAPRRPTPAENAEGDEGAMIATVSPLDPVDDSGLVSVLEASLTAPAEAGSAALDGAQEPAGQHADDPGATEIGSAAPARALWPISSRRMARTPSADEALKGVSAADEEPHARGPATILESRLPKESPRILLR
ncbi:MAG: hypothetical protein NT171_19040 [Planctomycetota bacterium]|jgi:hypothetical protein|nr:hypothetical protein [Planctomycetota bacterium]